MGLAPGDVYAALLRNNFLAAVGQTKGNLVQVNLLANTDLRSADEFRDLIVAERKGAIVRLKDVATVELGAEEATTVAKYGQKEAVYLGVWPLVGVNEIEVAHRLRAEMDRIRPTLPPDVDMQMAYDATVFMEDALKEISKTLTETILIVGLVVFLFMGSIRTALVPLVAMPISLVGAAIVMSAAGFSLNLLTILAIVLSVGLVVDDAIVVVENVERHVREGRSRKEAALLGARELVGPILAMTVTLAAVYTPIGFQGGLTGSLFLEFAITLAAAVVVSGIVAVTLSPVMSSRFVQEHGHETRLTAAGESRLRRGSPEVRPSAGRCDRNALGGGRGRGPGDAGGVAAVQLLAEGAGPGRGPEPHQPLHAGVAGLVARGDQPRLAGGGEGDRVIPRGEVHVVPDLQLGRLRGDGDPGLEGAPPVHRADVRGGLRQGLADPRPSSVPPPRSAAAHARTVRRRADPPVLGAGGAASGFGRPGPGRRVEEREVPVRGHAT